MTGNPTTRPILTAAAKLRESGDPLDAQLASFMEDFDAAPASVQRIVDRDTDIIGRVSQLALDLSIAAELSVHVGNENLLRRFADAVWREVRTDASMPMPIAIGPYATKLHEGRARRLLSHFGMDATVNEHEPPGVTP